MGAGHARVWIVFVSERAALISEHTNALSYCYPADVSQREQMEEVFSSLTADAGRIDILVNNAGMNIRTPALEVTEQEWETIVGTNLKSALIASQLLETLRK